MELGKPGAPGWLRELEPGEKRLRGNLLALHNSLAGGANPGQGSGFSPREQVRRGKGLKQCQDLDWIQEKFLHRVVKHWNRLSRDVVESPSPEVSKKSCLDVAPGDLV